MYFHWVPILYSCRWPRNRVCSNGVASEGAVTKYSKGPLRQTNVSMSREVGIILDRINRQLRNLTRITANYRLRPLKAAQRRRGALHATSFTRLDSDGGKWCPPLTRLFHDCPFANPLNSQGSEADHLAVNFSF